ncbi:MAG: RNA-binding protein [Nitrospinae bacterium]|nr:RNA-binding protein [Nitrospinota bacterium]
MNIFVGNLAFNVTESDLRPLFEEFGELESLKLITDRETGRSRGFAFVEMNNSDADRAIKALNGKDLQGRNMKVNQAEPRKAKPARRSW